MGNWQIFGYQVTPAYLVVGAGVTLAILAALLSSLGSRGSASMYCPTCGTRATPKSKYQGSEGVGILLLLLFFPAFIVYEVWRHSAPKWVCPACHRGGMLPSTAPAAKRAAAAVQAAAIQEMGQPGREPDGPGRFAVWGVDRATAEDTSLYIDADSMANAQVKADLWGITVTHIQRV